MYLTELITDRAVVSQLACLAAVHYCAKRTVAERIANLTLTPPLLKAEDKAKAAADKKAADDAAAAAGPRPPWYRRIFTYKTLEALFPLLVFGAIEFVVLWVMPRVTSELFIQVFWVGVSSYLISGPISACLCVFFGGPSTMAFRRGEKNPKTISLSTKPADPDNKPFFAVKRNRLAVAILITAAFVGYTAYDPLNYIMPLFASALVISIWSSVSFPRFSIRVASMICFGFVSLLALLVPIIVLAMRYFAGSNEDKTPSKGGMPVMPPWILSLMLIYNDSIMVFPVMFLATAALRYDHFGPSPALGPDKAAPGAAVDVPRSINARVGTMYRTAMTALVGCYLASDVVIYHLVDIGKIKINPPTEYVRERSNLIKLASFATINLLVPFVIALVAWSKGELKSWWTYTETWVPKDYDDAMEQADINEAEKALLEPEQVQPAIAAAATAEKA